MASRNAGMTTSVARHAIQSASLATGAGGLAAGVAVPGSGISQWQTASITTPSSSPGPARQSR
jgi:hypothetical protein